MIALAAASAIYLTGLQAGINAPRSAFNDCLTSTAAKAAQEKVAPDAYDAYLHTACDAKVSAFKAASVAFDVKNGIARKQATADADSMIDDWLQGAVRSYKAKASRQ